LEGALQGNPKLPAQGRRENPDSIRLDAVGITISQVQERRRSTSSVPDWSVKRGGPQGGTLKGKDFAFSGSCCSVGASKRKKRKDLGESSRRRQGNAGAGRDTSQSFICRDEDKSRPLGRGRPGGKEKLYIAKLCSHAL